MVIATEKKCFKNSKLIVGKGVLVMQNFTSNMTTFLQNKILNIAYQYKTGIVFV